MKSNHDAEQFLREHFIIVPVGFERTRHQAREDAALAKTVERRREETAPLRAAVTRLDNALAAAGDCKWSVIRRDTRPVR